MQTMTVSTCCLKPSAGIWMMVLLQGKGQLCSELYNSLRSWVHLGFYINFSKCELFSRGGNSLFPPVVKSSLLPNLVVLGVPIGNYVHCARFISEKCTISKALLKALVDVSAVDLHVAFTLLRMCGSYCKLVHLTRATPPSLCADSFQSFDEEIRLCFASCLAVDVSLAASTAQSMFWWTRLSFPCSSLLCCFHLIPCLFRTV